MDNTQTIYFSHDDEDRDGNGWNIVSDNDSIALRFSTLERAQQWCSDNGYEYTINYFPYQDLDNE